MAWQIASGYSGSSLAVAVGTLVSAAIATLAMVLVSKRGGDSEDVAERDREIVRLERRNEHLEARVVDLQAQVLLLYERVFQLTGKGQP